MDPTLEEKQSGQPQQKQSRQGFSSRATNLINNIGGAKRLLSSPINKIGQRVVSQTILRGFAAFLAGPGLPVVVALGLVLLFTVIILMGFGGAPFLELNTQKSDLSPTSTQSATPTATIITPILAP